MYIGKEYQENGIKYSTLNSNQIKEIHSASCRILEETGMVVHHEEALRLLKQAGAYVKGNVVFVPPSLVENAIRSAPQMVTIYDRDGNPAMFLEDSNVYYGTGSDTIYVIDHVGNKQRKWTKKDVERGIILSENLENIDFNMSLGVMSDVDIRMNTREQYATMIRSSRKPQVVVCENAHDLKDIINMAAAVRGGSDELQQKPLFVLYCEPTSPLENSYEAIDKLLLAAECRIPTNYAAGGMAGATTPITAEGTILLGNAECLFGLVVHQLKNPGAPFVYGFGNAPIDMKTMQACYATPVAIQIQGGMCDLAKHYGLPSWGEAGNGCSKKCDEQAVMEGSQFILMAALQGCNLTHDVGYLDFGLSFSLELLTIFDEAISRTKQIFKPLQINKEFLGSDAIKRVGHGGDFLKDEHTFKHFKSNWRGTLSDFYSHTDWVNNGSLSMAQRANIRVEEILANAKPVTLPESVENKIKNILDQAKS